MKRVWLGLLLLAGAIALSWWFWGGGGSPEARTVNLSVVNQTLYGAGPDGLIRVKEGDTVTIHLTCDEPMEVFLHGYDLETPLKPGAPSTIEFTANILGRFPLMIHSLGEGQEERKTEILLGLVDVLPR